MSTDARTVAVIGAGPLGRGIAHEAALAGYRTILEDVLPTSLRRAEDQIRGHLGRAVGEGKLAQERARAALERLEYATTLEEAAREADIVIEAVPEEFDSKEEIFRLLDKFCRPEVILVTNVSTIKVTEIGAVTLRGPWIVGMDFRRPVHEMQEIRITRGAETRDEAVSAAEEIARRMGKKAVLVNEARG